MKYRQMGKLDWKVSALGFGAMRLPTKGLLKKIDEEEAIRIIRRGIDLGINYVDTAWPYHLGQSEKVLGKALQDGYREKVKLVTKLPVYMVRKPEDFDKYLKIQLDRLQTSYVDLYLFHGINKYLFKTIKKHNLLKKVLEKFLHGRR